jgi:6-phosphogluconolactonase (cycloisomerase 2 family)
MTGTDTIAHFSISPDGDGGKLDLVEHIESGGRQPRAFVLFGQGQQYAMVGNMAGPKPTTVAFERDAKTGAWTRVAELQFDQGKGHTAFALVQ